MFQFQTEEWPKPFLGGAYLGRWHCLVLIHFQAVAGGKGLLVLLFQIINETCESEGRWKYDCVSKYLTFAILAILKIAIETKHEQEQNYCFPC